MLLDAVLANTRYSWLGTEQDKLAYLIIGLLQTRLQKREYPHLVFGEGDNHTVRYFPDKLPIGVEGEGGRRHRHAELLRALPEWTIRLLIPRRFRKAAALYRYAVRDEFATPLKPSTVEELEWFFRARKGDARGVTSLAGRQGFEPR
jgi:hypothetical protein